MCVNKLGFGFMRLPYRFNVETNTEEIDIELVNRMVDEYISRGGQYFETARPYMKGKCEEVFKVCVSDRYARDKYLLADKLPFNLKYGEDLNKVFEEQLLKCGVEFFDYYLLHNINSKVLYYYEKIGGFEFLRKMKELGKVRNIGFSFHGTPELLEQVLSKYPDMDFVQLQLNYWDWESVHIQSRRCHEVARKYDKRIFVMEPIKGGALANIPSEAIAMLHEYESEITPVEFAFSFVNSLDGVELVLSGMSSYEQVLDNTKLFENMKSMSEKGVELAKNIVQILNKKNEISCTSCEYCIEKCPAKINIPKLFSLYNSYKNAGSEDRTALSRHQLLLKAIDGTGRVRVFPGRTGTIWC